MAGIESKNSPQPTLIMRLPAGTSLYGVVAFHQRLWNTSTKRTQTLLGDRNATLRDVALPSRWCKLLFPWAPSAQPVLEDHTLYGFFARTISATSAVEWAKTFDRGFGAPLRRFVPGMRHHVYSVGDLRWCPQCVAEQTATHGAAFWRFLHQLAGLDACDIHGVPLRSTCPRCNHPRKNRGHAPLPADPCTRCGQLPAEANPSARISEGAARLAAICGEIASGRCTDLEPLTWVGHIRHALEKTGGYEQLQGLLTKALANEWSIAETDSEKLANLRDFVRRETSLLTFAADAVPRASVLGAMRGLSLLAEQPHHWIPGEDRTAYEVLARDRRPLGLLPLLREEIASEVVQSRSGLSGTQVSVIYGSARYLLKDLGITPSRIQVNFKNSQDEKRRNYYRTRVLAVIASNGPMSRTSVRKVLHDQVDWLIKHDADWVDSVLPSMRQQPPRTARHEYKRDSYRKRIKAVIVGGRIGWSEVQGVEPSPFAWLYVHDRDWLEQNLVRRKMANHAPLAVKKRAYRAQLLELRSSGVKLRSKVRKAAIYAASWAFVNDRKWYDRNFPPAQNKRSP